MFIEYKSLLAAFYLNASQMSNVTVVLLYAALLVVITSLISLRTNDPDPMLAGCNMPWWLIAGSIVGTSISNMAFLLCPEQGYEFDFNYLVSLSIGSLIACFLSGMFFVKFLRTTPDASIYTLLGNRFGRWSSMYASVSFILYSTMRMGLITCLVGQAIHLICGVDIGSVILLTGVIVIFYTYMSGIEGVIWTDFFQTSLLIIAGLASVWFLWDVLHVYNSVHSDEIGFFLNLMPKKSLFSELNGWMLCISILFFIAIDFAFYTSNQGVAQRYIVARSNGHAQWGLAVGGIGVPLIIALFFGIGVLLYFFYNSGLVPGVSSVAESKNIFAHFIAHYFPDGLKGLAIVGILAAAMSTIDTGINSSSTVLICNLYEPYARASAIRQSLLTTQILRGSSVVFGAAGILAAYFVYLSGANILDLFWQAQGVINAGLFGLFLLLRISKKAGPKAAIWAASAGSVLAVWMTFTAGADYFWASPFHYMLTLPMSALVIVALGVGLSYCFKEDICIKDDFSHLSAKLRQELAQKRKAAKKNIFNDSLRPKVFYRIYASIAAAAGFVIYLESNRLQLSELDIKCVLVSMGLLLLIAIMPFFVKNVYNKRYATFYLTALGLALPFLGAMALFTHPDEVCFSYFYLATVGVLGCMVGWTMLGLLTMIATAIAGQVAVFLSLNAGISDNWATVAIGALAIFTYFAMEAAKENLVTERTLGRIHTIVGKIYEKVADLSAGIALSKKPLNIQDMDHLVKSSGDAKLMLSALLGATDVNPGGAMMELSIRETLTHVALRFSKKSQTSIRWEGDDDFFILGNRDIFESIVYHVLENAFYYIDRDEATQVIFRLNQVKQTLSILNNGPQIQPADAPYLFDLGYHARKESLGLGLTYCKKMLEGMRSGIRLISKPHEQWVHFCLYFPKYGTLPPEAQSFKIQDEGAA